MEVEQSATLGVERNHSKIDEQLKPTTPISEDVVGPTEQSATCGNTKKAFLQPGSLFYDLIIIFTITDDGHLLLMLVLALCFGYSGHLLLMLVLLLVTCF